MFVPGVTFQPNLMFKSKDMSLPKKWQAAALLKKIRDCKCFSETNALAYFVNLVFYEKHVL